MRLERGDLLAYFAGTAFLVLVAAGLTIAIVVLWRKRSLVGALLTFGLPMLLCLVTLSLGWLDRHFGGPWGPVCDPELLVLANSVLAAFGPASAAFVLPEIAMREKAGLIVAGAMFGFMMHGMLAEHLRLLVW